jgi:hypothetical protein
MNNSKNRINKCAPPDGFFIYSSCGCGDDCAIRFCHIEEFEKTFSLGISPQEAIKLAESIKEIAIDYINGKETGIYSLASKCDYD